MILGAPHAANAADYSFGQEGSKVQFVLKHLGMITIEGKFLEFSGIFYFDRGNIGKSRVTMTLRTESVYSGNPMRDAHLKSEKFFWAGKYPEIIFKSQSIKNIQGESFDILGKLTIRGITRPVVFHTELCCEVPDESGGTRLLFNTETKIHRKDFKLGTGGLLDPIMLVTNEELKIILEVEGVSSGPAAPSEAAPALPAS